MKQKRIFRTALALFLLLALCIPASAAGFTGKLIAITFDDGPGAYTAALLDELAARDVKATFFVSGYRAKGYPETLKAYRRGGAPAGKPHAEPRKPQHALQQQNRQRDQPDAGAHHGSGRR